MTTKGTFVCSCCTFTGRAQGTNTSIDVPQRVQRQEMSSINSLCNWHRPMPPSAIHEIMDYFRIAPPPSPSDYKRRKSSDASRGALGVIWHEHELWIKSHTYTQYGRQLLLTCIKYNGVCGRIATSVPEWIHVLWLFGIGQRMWMNEETQTVSQSEGLCLPNQAVTVA